MHSTKESFGKLESEWKGDAFISEPRRNSEGLAILFNEAHPWLITNFEDIINDRNHWN